MRQYLPNASTKDVANVLGYTLGQAMEHVIRKAGKNLTRRNLMKQAASIRNLRLPMLLPGIVINTAANDYLMIDQLQMKRFDGKQWVLFGPLVSGR